MEEVVEEDGQRLAHHATVLEDGREGVADLGQAVLPVAHHQGDPAGRLAVHLHDPLELLAPAAVEVGHALAGDVGAELRGRQLVQGLIAAHAGFGAPLAKEVRVPGRRRTQRHLIAESTLGHGHGDHFSRSARQSRRLRVPRKKHFAPLRRNRGRQPPAPAAPVAAPPSLPRTHQSRNDGR